MGGFTTHAGFQSFRTYTEPYSSTCILAPDFNILNCGGAALDSSLHSNTLTRSQIVPTMLPSGLKVSYFDGLGVRIASVPQSATINNLATQTIVGWVNPDADITSTAKIFEKGSTTDDHTSLSWITDGALVFYRQRATTSPTWTTATGFAPVSTWTMYSVAYDTTSVNNDPTVYKNGCGGGALTESAAPVGAISDDSAKNIYLGSRSAGTLPFKGYIGQTWEFNVILDPTRIAAIYNQTKWLYGV